MIKNGVLLVVILLCALITDAANRTSAVSGDWNVAATWTPAGIPTAMDNITIANGHTITISSKDSSHHITINTGGTLTWKNASTLVMTGNLMVNGKVTMNGGNITATTNGSAFILGNNSTFTWEPGDNSLAGASLFTKGIESFASSSNLIIKKWYDYTVGLGSVVTGTFGNLELNSMSNSNINEWNQNNEFEKHSVLGQMTIDQGWITLDKSGKISNTIIGSIYLKNVNSSFYAHNGKHPSFFTLLISSVVNNGGNFIGLSDGNGNVEVHVTGNFTNIGNVKIINNTGISGVSNGDATFKVDSTYSQNTGDTRIIYNVSTTNSGLYNCTIRNLVLNGGIFMGQTGCRVAGGICKLSILENLSINFAAINDKFRGTSLSSIGSNLNNVELNFSIGGDFAVKGISTAEVTSAAAAGKETVTIGGNISVQGCNVSLNYGAVTASHASSATITGSIFVDGGTLYLSRNNGKANILIGKNLELTSGICVVKGADSAASVEVVQNYIQKGGTLFMHNNGNSASTIASTLTVNGDFIQSGGDFNFDFNPSPTSASHCLRIAGPNYVVSNGTITHAGVNVQGKIIFARIGTTEFKRSGTLHNITYSREIISSGSILSVMEGELQIGNTSTLELEGGILMLNGSTLTINNSSPSSVKRTSGYINSEVKNGRSGSILWKSMNNSAYTFPFGAKDDYTPVILTPYTIGDVTISTYSTGPDNMPFPTAQEGINFDYYERGSPNYTSTTIIDRWWSFNSSQEMLADVTLSYAAFENTLAPYFRTSYLNVLQWNGSGWDVVSKANAVTSGMGTINVAKSALLSSWVVGHEESGGLIPVTEFKTEMVGKKVALSWLSPVAKGTFSIERSTDGQNFQNISEIPGIGNKTETQKSYLYSEVDLNPLQGTSYYRIKYTDSNGNISYSRIQAVNNESIVVPGLTINDFGPNPFKNNFWMKYKINSDDIVKLQIIGNNGQVVYTIQKNENAGEHTFEYDNGDALPAGIYFVSVESNGKSAIQKLIKN